MTDATLFTDLTQNSIIAQHRAELYMRIYPFMAEDFVNHQDFTTFMENLTKWMSSIEEKLTKQGAALAKHTHGITPHTHTIPQHVHTIPPHFHPHAYGPTGPVPLTTLVESPRSTLPNDMLQTQVPEEPSGVNWQTGTIPNPYSNTSGATTNLVNTIVVGSGTIGDATPRARRSIINPQAATPTIPPYLTPNVV